jgi:hypothetical protein
MPSPSPTCLISGSATPADVTASGTISGALASATGVVFWGVTAIGTDELNTPAAVNATLTVNMGAHTFSFTAPSGLGSTVIFQSTVGAAGSTQGHGVDVNGNYQPSYTTTFKVNVKTAGGLRVMAENESFEQDSVFGWISEVNKGIRAATAGGATTVTGTGFWHNIAGALQAAALIGTAGQFAVTAAGASDVAFATISGDVSASTTTPGALTVTGLQGRAVSSTAPTNNYVLTWSSGSSSWVPAAASAANTITGTGLWYNVSGSLQAAALFGTAGQLPFVNAAATAVSFASFTGDVTLSTATPGYAKVVGLYDISIPSPSGSNTVLQYNAGTFTWATVSSGSFTPGSDLLGNSTSTATHQYVSALSYSSAAGGGSIAVNGTNTLLNWVTNAVTLQQGATTALQLGFASTDFIALGVSPPGAGYIRFGGTNVTLLEGIGGGGVSAPLLVVDSNANLSVGIGTTNPGGLGSNVNIVAQNGTGAVGGNVQMFVGNGSTPGNIVFGLGGGTSTTSTIALLGSSSLGVMQWSAGITPQLSQAQQANGSDPANFTIMPQAPGSGASSTGTGTPGSFIVDVAAPVSTGALAAFIFQQAGTPYLTATSLLATVGVPLTVTGIVTMTTSAINWGTSGVGAVNHGGTTSAPYSFTALGGGSAISVAGTNPTLSSTQMGIPIIELTGTLSGTCTITLPNSIGAVWWFNISAVVFASHAIIFTTGSGTTDSISALKASGYNLIMVSVTSSHNVAVG